MGELGGLICWPGGWGGTQTIYWPRWQVGGGVEDDNLCAPSPFPTLFSVPGNHVAQPLLPLASRDFWPMGGKSRRQEAREERVGAQAYSLPTMESLSAAMSPPRLLVPPVISLSLQQPAEHL